MNYYVSIANTPYYHWQIELLIESFKYYQLEDHLYISVADYGVPVYSPFTKNLQNHKNKIIHEAFPHKAQNRLYGIMRWLGKGMTTPLTCIHADMVLMNPVQEFNVPVVFQDGSPTHELTEAIGDLIKEYFIKSNATGFLSIPLGDIMIFGRECDNMFFVEADYFLKRILNKYPDINFDLEKAMWLLTIYHRFFSNFEFFKVARLEQSLMEHMKNANFIHYKHGLPPEFSKLYYKYEPPITFIPAGDNPFEALLKLNVTSSTDYVCNLITSYLKSGS